MALSEFETGDPKGGCVGLRTARQLGGDHAELSRAQIAARRTLDGGSSSCHPGPPQPVALPPAPREFPYPAAAFRLRDEDFLGPSRSLQSDLDSDREIALPGIRPLNHRLLLATCADPTRTYRGALESKGSFPSRSSHCNCRLRRRESRHQVRLGVGSQRSGSQSTKADQLRPSRRPPRTSVGQCTPS
jgi:hypothetical protein